jgi:hypothetical protein
MLRPRACVSARATSAAEKGASAERIMDHAGYKSVAMMRIYTRRADAFQDHAGEGLL